MHFHLNLPLDFPLWLASVMQWYTQGAELSFSQRRDAPHSQDDTVRMWALGRPECGAPG